MSHSHLTRGRVIAALVGAFVLLVAAGATAPLWWQWARAQYAAAVSGNPVSAQHELGGEDEHDHSARHGENSLELSEQARRNIGLELGEVQTGPFQRAITVPAVVVERPGRTEVRVAAPLTGVITDIFAVSGEAVEPGDTLFILRLTHEDLVQAQTEFLKTLEALDVENSELARLEQIGQGVVAGRIVLERQYEKQKLEGELRAQREALLLHGLSEAQVEEIVQQRKLLRELRVAVPELHDETEDEHLLRRHASAVGAPDPPQAAAEGVEATGANDVDQLVLQELAVRKGDFVEAGTTLASLVDLEHLYIEGRAFEQDAAAIAEAARLDRSVTALPEDGLGGTPAVAGLEIAFLSNRIEQDSRALHLYVHLPNEVVDEVTTPDGHHFLTWRFKPGQRMRLRVPVETWQDQIVLPVEAVAEDGAERYVFVQNGNQLERRPVHILYRDSQQAVVANDGSLFPGDRVALNAAHQLQIALQNQTGNASDPHAGHNH